MKIERILRNKIEGVTVHMDPAIARRKMNSLFNAADYCNAIVEGHSNCWVDYDYSDDVSGAIKDEWRITLVATGINLIHTDAIYNSWNDESKLEETWFDLIVPIKWFLALPEEDLIDSSVEH